MTGTNTPAEDVEALNTRMTAPEVARRPRNEAQADAAGRPDVSPARLGAELAAEDRPADKTETAESLKRAAENDRRV
jgi:hypothetical protein